MEGGGEDMRYDMEELIKDDVIITGFKKKRFYSNLCNVYVMLVSKTKVYNRVCKKVRL